MSDGTVSGSAGEARALARSFLRQTLSAEGNALILEHATRNEVLGRLVAARRASARVGGSRPGGQGTETNAAARGVADAGAAVEATDARIAAAGDLDVLTRLVAGCSRCPLHETRKHPVFGEGAADARVVCVGEAPGAREDETGRPFVGRAGRLLDRLLMSIGLPRASVYICNVLKSRPPRNRDPLPAEVAACAPFLERQLALIRPEVIIAFGAFAARTLLDTKAPLGRMRGGEHRYAGYPVVVTYHPAALLRNPAWVRPTWDDLQRVRRMLDGIAEGGERHG